MKEQLIGGVEFTSNITDSSDDDPYIMGVFADESAGKTRLSLTGPDHVGCIVTEMKSYKTLKKDAAELGKTVYYPKDPLKLIAKKRELDSMKSDVERQKEYQRIVKLIEDSTYGMLEHKDINLVVLDKFTHYCVYKEFAINGIGENFVKVDGKLVQRKSEVIQGIIDFMNGLSHYGKPVMLLCSAKPDYDVLDSEKKPMRNTANCGSFYFVGSHTNLMIELQANQRFDPKSANKKRDGWRYSLGVRRCQVRPELEGPQGNPLLQDDEITLPGLISQVEGERFDPERWM